MNAWPIILSVTTAFIFIGLVSPSASVGGVFLWPERGAGRAGINLEADHPRWNTGASDRRFGPSSTTAIMLPILPIRMST